MTEGIKPSEVAAWGKSCCSYTCKTGHYHGCPYGADGVIDCVDRLNADLDELIEAAAEVMDMVPYELLTEWIKAFNEGRMVIN